MDKLKGLVEFSPIKTKEMKTIEFINSICINTNLTKKEKLYAIKIAAKTYDSPILMTIQEIAEFCTELEGVSAYTTFMQSKTKLIHFGLLMTKTEVQGQYSFKMKDIFDEFPNLIFDIKKSKDLIEQNKLKKIIELNKLGKSLRQIEKEIGISKSTVCRILKNNSNL